MGNLNVTGNLVNEKLNQDIKIDLGFDPVDTNGTTSYYALWKFKIGDIKIIGGKTPKKEGNVTVNLTMNDAPDTPIFSKVLAVIPICIYQGSTNNGWGYASIQSQTSAKISQTSYGAMWIAIGI